MQERENWSVAETTFLDSGLNLSLTSVCVGMGLAYCFMLMLLVAKAFRRPEGDSCTTGMRAEGIVTRGKETKLRIPISTNHFAIFKEDGGSRRRNRRKKNRRKRK